MAGLILLMGLFAGTAAMLAAKCIELLATCEQQRRYIRRQNEDIAMQKNRITDLNGMIDEMKAENRELEERCGLRHSIRKIVL